MKKTPLRNPFKKRKTAAELMGELRPLATEFGVCEAYLVYDGWRNPATDRPEWIKFWFTMYPEYSCREDEFENMLRERFNGQIIPCSARFNTVMWDFARNAYPRLFS